MATLDLRPLSLGEILDRTFTLYRSHFLLFFGIAVIPQLFVLALQLTQLFLGAAPVPPGTRGAPPVVRPGLTGASIVVGLLTLVIVLLAYLLWQGATVSAVAELYLGRTPAIGESFRKVRRDLGTLFGVAILNFLVVLVGFILLIIPGVYLGVPASCSRCLRRFWKIWARETRLSVVWRSPRTPLDARSSSFSCTLFWLLRSDF